MSEKLPPKITQRLALLVEGKDEVNFFTALTKRLNINNVFISEVGGHRQFHNKLPAMLIYPGFRDVRAYAIIRDADQNADNTFISVRDLLNRHKQPCPARSGEYAPGPPKVGVYIMPGNAMSGMLENLCMETVGNNPVIQCVNTFMTCVENHVQWPDPTVEHPAPPNNLHKARAKCFLAGNQYDLPSVGVAALNGVWDFDHAGMQQLRNFLTELAA